MTEKLIAIRETLQKLQIQATYDNMDRLLGVIMLLSEMISEEEQKNADNPAE